MTFLALALVQITKYWKWIAGAVILIVLVVAIRNCGRKPAKLDEAATQKAQVAIATQDREAMVQILAESQVKEKQIDANIANANIATTTAIVEAKKEARNLTNEELAKALEERLNQ